MLLKGLNLGPRQCVFPSLAVCLSLECKASQRELTSRLLSDLIAKQVLNEGDLTNAFNHTLAQLPELILDTPDAPQVTLTHRCSYVLICLLVELSKFIMNTPD